MDANQCLRLANIISGYRNTDVGDNNSEHVYRWLAQFDESDQAFVLSETEYLLQQTYLNNDDLREKCSALLDQVVPKGLTKSSFWQNTSIVVGQAHSASQQFMGTLARNILSDSIGVAPEFGTSSKNVLYLDDISGTGNQMRQEILDLLQKIPGKFLHVAHIVSHSSDYLQRSAVEAAAHAVSTTVFFRDSIRAENRKKHSAESHVLYPISLSDGGVFAQTWLEQITEESYQTNLRTASGQGLFSSSSARDRYEIIMFEKGAYITTLPIRPRRANEIMKPLGYKSFPGFGFGMVYTTARNCPNNCPLSWWWGDRSGTKTTLKKWYPLLERRIRDADAD